MSRDFDIAAFRARFPSLPRLTYLNSGSYGLLSDSVKEAFGSYMDIRIEKGADWGGWVGALEETRGLMAALLDVDADEVAITGSASAGINALAGALDFSGARNRIAVTNFDFPTSAQIWHAQERVGAEVIHVPEAGDGVIPLEAFERVIDERTAIVVLSQLCYRHGGRIPDADIKAIAAMAHAKGALVILDTYQIVGTLPIRPRELDVDFCVGGMLKYLLGTAGIGFFYVRQPLIETVVPRATGWFAQANIDAMDIFAHQPSPTARRFEAGTPPVPNCVATAAGLRLIVDTGLDAIGEQVRSVTRYTQDALKSEGLSFNNPDADERRGPLISIRTSDEGALVSALAEKNIITSSRDGRLRAGFHAYNDTNDADAFVAALSEYRNILL